MKLHHGVLMAAFLAAVIAGESRAQEADVSKMMAEISQLSAEQKQIPAKLQQNLALRAANNLQLEKLKQDLSRVQAESSAIKAQGPSVDSACTGTYPRDQFPAAQARCDAVKNPFNQRVEANNARRRKGLADVQELKQKENKRRAQEEQLIARDQQITQRIAALQATIKTARASSCTQSCRDKQNDAAAQCLQSCFDGARSDTALPTVEENYRPPFTATPNRTPEQAIEEYRRSGAAQPGPSTLRTNPVPPPSPSR